MQIQNTNFLQSTKFTMSFDRLPAVEYFLQEVNVPGMTLSALSSPTPFVDLKIPGDKIEYDTLKMTFLIDEEMKTWLEIYAWIQAMAFPENFDQYKNLKNLGRVPQFSRQPQYSNGTLNILTALNNIKFQVNYVDLFPVSLSSIEFNSTDENTTTMVATAEFGFTYFSISQIQ